MQIMGRKGGGRGRKGCRYEEEKKTIAIRERDKRGRNRGETGKGRKEVREEEFSGKRGTKVGRKGKDGRREERGRKGKKMNKKE